jgi:hypothetical protein
MSSRSGDVTQDRRRRELGRPFCAPLQNCQNCIDASPDATWHLQYQQRHALAAMQFLFKINAVNQVQPNVQA